MFLRCVVSHVAAITLVAVASQSEQTDVGFDLHVTNSVGPARRTCFDASGLPASSSGTYFIAGPAKFDGLPEGQWKFKAIFDGIGMVNRFELRPKDQPSKMCYTSAWLGSKSYDAFEKDHKEPPRGVLFEDTIPKRSDCFMEMCDYNAPNDNNWVNMITVGDQALWLSDTTVMVTMDPETMVTSGWKSWKNDKQSMGHAFPEWVSSAHMGAGGSAHPLVRPGTQTVVEILVEMPILPLGNYYLDIYTFDASAVGSQDRTRMANLKIDDLQYIHSFGVTPNYVVLPFNLKNVNLGPMHEAFLLGKFEKAWGGVHIVDTNGKDRVFNDLDPFFHVHIANTFENASGIVMDLATYQEIPFARMAVMDISTNLNKTARDNSFPRGQMVRMHFNLQSKKTTVQKLTGNNNRDYDFLKINPGKAGLPYCIYYAVEWYHNDKDYGSMAILKHDICQDKMVYWSEPNVYLNEPFFIPDSPTGAEDAGTLIFTANDGQTGKAIFVALDARTFEQKERIELPNHMPFTAHGSFIPQKPDELIAV